MTFRYFRETFSFIKEEKTKSYQRSVKFFSDAEKRKNSRHLHAGDFLTSPSRDNYIITTFVTLFKYKK